METAIILIIMSLIHLVLFFISTDTDYLVIAHMYAIASALYKRISE